MPPILVIESQTMSELQGLGYMGVPAAQMNDWADFAQRLLGLELADRTGTTLALRMDERKQRLIIGPEDSAAFFGWEVADASTLRRLGDRLDRAGVRIERGSAALADQRRVAELIRFSDPAGNILEAFHGAEMADTAFRPGRSISGFRTGALGMGHVVLTVERIEDIAPFYQEILGFRLSDFALRPFRAYFYHLNARHHSLAFVETGRRGIHHLMMELLSLDDVGQAYDLALPEPDRIGATLGRHTNDFMTSFYVWTPSRFMIEYGWGGRSIDPTQWRPEQLTYGPSLWGHDRTWLAPAGRAEARELRLRAAAQGTRAPVQVVPGNYHLSQDGPPSGGAAPNP
jgi:2,3-dihydroxybiphenyl 1,2-dioxygenase